MERYTVGAASVLLDFKKEREEKNKWVATSLAAIITFCGELLLRRREGRDGEKERGGVVETGGRSGGSGGDLIHTHTHTQQHSHQI